MLKLPLDNIKRVKRILEGNINKVMLFPYNSFLSCCEVKLFDTRYNTYCLYLLDLNMVCLVGIYYIDEKVVTNLSCSEGKITFTKTNSNEVLYAYDLTPLRSKITEVPFKEFCVTNWSDINDSLVNLNYNNKSDYLNYLSKVLLEYNLLSLYKDLKLNLINKHEVTPLSYELSKNILDIIDETLINIQRLNKEYPYHLLVRN